MCFLTRGSFLIPCAPAPSSCSNSGIFGLDLRIHVGHSRMCRCLAAVCLAEPFSLLLPKTPDQGLTSVASSSCVSSSGQQEVLKTDLLSESYFQACLSGMLTKFRFPHLTLKRLDSYLLVKNLKSIFNKYLQVILSISQVWETLS